MADAEVTTPATDGVTPDMVEPPPPSSSSEPVDPPPPTVNGVAEHAAAPAAVPAAVDAGAEEAPSSSKTGSEAAPRIDVTGGDESEQQTSTSTSVNKYEMHDKETESADRVAAVLKSVRLQVDNVFFYSRRKYIADASVR